MLQMRNRRITKKRFSDKNSFVGISFYLMQISTYFDQMIGKNHFLFFIKFAMFNNLIHRHLLLFLISYILKKNKN